jgi:tetratricopeptide (TPR) repeat protein
LRRTHPEAVGQTGSRLTDYAYALVLENGFDKYERFPTLEAEWPTIAAALPLWVQGSSASDRTSSNERLQSVYDALNTFLNFSGRWDEWLVLSQQAEAKAEAAEDFYNAGWRAYDAGWVYFLRGQADEVLDCADRCFTYWETASHVGAGEKGHAIRLRGLGRILAKAYPAAIAAFQEALALYRAIAPESEAVAAALNDLAEVERAQGDYAAAEHSYREALRIAQKIDGHESIAIYSGNLAELALDREEWMAAETLAREALALIEKVGRQELIGDDCRILAKALARQGNLQEGRLYAHRAVTILTRLRAPAKLAEAQAVLEECGG